MNPSYRVYQVIWGCLDWLFPPECGGCKRVGFRWCPDCQQQVRLIPEPVCELCGLPLNRAGLCASCAKVEPPYTALRSWAVFEHPLRQALHSLKYRRNIALGDALAGQLTRFTTSLKWPVDLVVPVPLGKARMRERGYNQTGLVALPLAVSLHLEYSPRALKRCRETRTQVGLTPEERQENVRGAFRAETGLVKGRKVLLMDDVATTGATLAAGATALLEAGASTVFGLTLTRALPDHSSR